MPAVGSSSEYFVVRKGATALRNEVVWDARISYGALGILVRALATAPGAPLGYRAFTGRGMGEKAVRAALGELEAAGYRHRLRWRDDQGRWRTLTVVSDVVLTRAQVLAELPQEQRGRVVDDVGDRPGGVGQTRRSDRAAAGAARRDQAKQAVSAGRTVPRSTEARSGAALSLRDTRSLRDTPDQTGPGDVVSSSPGPVGSGGVGGAPPGAPPPPPSSSVPRPGGPVGVPAPVVGTAAGPGALPGAGEASGSPGAGGLVAGDASQSPCEAPGAAVGGPGAPQGGPGAGRRSEGLSAPLGVVSAPVVGGGGLAGLLGACLPAPMRVMDAAGARRVGALLAERLEAGWRPEEIRALLEGPLPSPVRRMSALVASRLEANVAPALAPSAAAAAAGRGRAAVERDRSEEARARCEALAAPSPAAPARRGRDRAWGAALARARAADPSAGLVEVAAAAAALLARQGPAGAVGAPGAT